MPRRRLRLLPYPRARTGRRAHPQRSFSLGRRQGQGREHHALRIAGPLQELGVGPLANTSRNTMSAVFKPDETFRDDFSYRNTPAAIRRFPLPFAEDAYMYSVNIEPHL